MCVGVMASLCELSQRKSAPVRLSDSLMMTERQDCGSLSFSLHTQSTAVYFKREVCVCVCRGKEADMHPFQQSTVRHFPAHGMSHV